MVNQRNRKWIMGPTWVSIVPFEMSDIYFRELSSLKSKKRFSELIVRTYVLWLENLMFSTRLPESAGITLPAEGARLATGAD
ncbi:DUF2071 domain-containing protein [Jeotgalibacillus malaysiensis]|uniref:DUF2071 domain-containing protein n=1 Tax=Jeotgalibacillus malaysiensis TaxID=1508404 RepID=UPI00384DFBB3